MKSLEEIYLAGGCLWGVQEFVRYLPGVISTEAGRANGTADSLGAHYDGYVECVKTVFDPRKVAVAQLLEYLFEIIDPYSVNQQGPDIGQKYRSGVYSKDTLHLAEAKEFISSRYDTDRIAVEVVPLSNYIRSDDQHQDRLTRCSGDSCHIPQDLLHKYK